MVFDDDLPQLTFMVNPSTISEGGGAYATWGTVELSEPVNYNTVIRLSADTPNQVFFPSQVTIGAGTIQQKFNIGAVDNTLLDGDRDVTVTAAIFISSCSCTAPAETTASSSHVIRIIDNDGPSLSVLAKPFVVPENIPDAGFITIQRNTLGGEAISVNIVHDGQAVLSLSATAVIPEGSVSVDVPFSTLDDGIDAGDQIATITVSSPDYSPGSAWIQVRDQNLPDFIPRGLSLSQESVMINQPVQVSVWIANHGFITAQEGTEVRFYQSVDTRVDGRDKLLSTILTSSVINRDDSVEVAFSYTPDDAVGDFYIIAVVNQGGNIRELTTINNTSEAVVFSVMPDYTAVASVDGDVFNGTAPIMINGLTQTINKSPVPNKPVDVYIMVNGSRRILKATSDENGEFSVPFIPVNGEAGAYSIGACYPELNTVKFRMNSSLWEQNTPCRVSSSGI
jgi:large repetitive protein